MAILIVKDFSVPCGMFEGKDFLSSASTHSSLKASFIFMNRKFLNVCNGWEKNLPLNIIKKFYFIHRSNDLYDDTTKIQIRLQFLWFKMMINGVWKILSFAFCLRFQCHNSLFSCFLSPFPSRNKNTTRWKMN